MKHRKQKSKKLSVPTIADENLNGETLYNSLNNSDLYESDEDEKVSEEGKQVKKEELKDEVVIIKEEIQQTGKRKYGETDENDENGESKKSPLKKSKPGQPIIRISKTANDKKTSYICRQENCDFTAESHRELLAHNRENHSRKKLKCHKCFFSCYRKDVLKIHCEQEHKGGENNPNDHDLLNCQFCQQPYETIQHLIKHEQNIHKIYRCNYKRKFRNHEPCPVLSPSIGHRDKHITEDHCYGYAWKEPIKGKSSNKNLYTCKFCWKKSFIKRHYLIAHIEDVCLKRSKKELADFQKQHTIKLNKDKKKHLKCEYEGCDYKTAEQRKLELHELVHTKEKPFNCRAPNTSCNKKFTYPTLRTVHEWKEHKFSIDGKDLSSTFECSECDFVGQPSVLKQHRQIHDKSREGRYECDTCGAKFKIKGTFNKHLKMHH